MDVPAAKSPIPSFYRSALLGNLSCSYRLWCWINKTWVDRERERLLWEGKSGEGSILIFRGTAESRKRKH